MNHQTYEFRVSGLYSEVGELGQREWGFSCIMQVSAFRMMCLRPSFGFADRFGLSQGCGTVVADVVFPRNYVP